MKGSPAAVFTAYRTAGNGREKYVALGDFTAQDGAISYAAPDNSVTVFFGKSQAKK